MNVGGGIVIDSVAERELDEMDEKSAAVNWRFAPWNHTKTLDD